MYFAEWHEPYFAGLISPNRFSPDFFRCMHQVRQMHVLAEPAEQTDMLHRLARLVRVSNAGSVDTAILGLG